jgi:hypothetical protein
LTPQPRFPPRQQGIDSGVYKQIDGIWHKRCRGPVHDEPVYLPASDKYFGYRALSGPRGGHFRSYCRLCDNWSKLKAKNRSSGWVPVSDARHFYLEAANRIGAKELSLRTGIHYQTITDVLQGRTKNVQRNKLRLVMLELVSIKRKGERSINSGSKRWAMHRATGGEVCSGCGGPMAGETEGCRTCLDRRLGRAKRERARKSESLTKGRAQLT